MIEVNHKPGHYAYSYNFGHYWDNSPNSAGGVGVLFSIKNIGDKTIKYVSIFFTAYNRVGDIVPSYVKELKSYGIRVTGPIEPNKEHKDNYAENIWYSSSISSIKISHAIVEYMDGSEETIPGDQINKIGTYKASNTSSDGCYIATAVYGSYDCPQVWTLRRYRDYTLQETWYGRLFVRTYYAISPTLVKWFGHTNWFKKMWKDKLDQIVENLNSKGVEDSPYEDKKW